MWCLLLLLFIANWSYAGDVGSVSVTTQFVGGQSAANVSVTVRSWATPVFEVIVKTDSNGKATVNNVPLGDLDVFALNEQGDVVAKFAGKLTSESQQVDVVLNMLN